MGDRVPFLTVDSDGLDLRLEVHVFFVSAHVRAHAGAWIALGSARQQVSFNTT